MSILNDLHELVSANIISVDTAHQISDYYKKKQERSPSAKNKQLLIFGILGALLVGIGLMFIIANQWEELPRSVKTACAFLLLVVPQLLCVYVLYKKADKVVWRESTALLLFFAVGANISLVSQIYHINGDTSSFLLIWMLLIAPLIYILKSSAVSLAYLFGIMFYSFAVRVDATGPWGELISWLLLVLPVPYYIQLLKKSPDTPLPVLHHWVIPIVLTVSLGTLSHNSGELMPPVYFTLFGIFYFIGNHSFFRNRPPEQCGYRIVGLAGSIITLFVMSFKSNWEKLPTLHYEWSYLSGAPEFIANVVLFAMASFLLYRQIRYRDLTDMKIMEVGWLFFLFIFILGFFTTLSVILVNLLVFVIGIQMIRDGSKQGNLGLLNTGMLIVTFLLLCRSFDIDLTYVVKGLLFVVVGIGFFVANWLMLKKKKENEA